MAIHKEQLIDTAKKLALPDLARFQQGFFKTHKGGYGEGDTFLGLTVPQTRSIAKQFRDLPLEEVRILLQNTYHEIRLIALHLLSLQYERAKDEKSKKAVVDAYLSLLDYVNNWDLVDTSAHKILGAWLLDKKDRKILWKLANSGHLWRERIAVVSTLWLIKHGQFEETILLSEHFLSHPHDLMHKAVGWMLREVGKKDEAVLRMFLDTHAATMPRTMLRYALEKLSPEMRAHYMIQKSLRAGA